MTEPTKKGDTVKLRECPFCGGTDLERISNGQSVDWVYCKNCCAEGPIASLKQGDGESSVVLWNTRSSPEVVTVTEEMIEAGAYARLEREHGTSHADKTKAENDYAWSVAKNRTRTVLEASLSKLSPLVQGDDNL